MKALILIGGFGTRLRPLTFTRPKPLINFCEVPILCHQIEALAKVGVKEVILAVSQQPDCLFEELKMYEEKYGVKITISIEKVPLGTAGPIRLAKDILKADNPDGLFFMFNADVICEYPLQNMLDFHKSHDGEGTIMVTQVEDPSKYGVVVSDDNGLI
jgi:mannose-1-phosphate guanylyltransferase